MTLKNFHIAFLVICTVLFTFLTVWAFVYAPDRTPVVTTLGVSGIAGLLLLPFYGIYFVRKIRNQHL
ncbi:MAG: hypothetical protein V4733_05715 [Verrucomicrobiota bacterium]